jgi:hypothetical protein
MARVLNSQLVAGLPCVLGIPPFTPAETDYSLETNLVSFLSSRPAIAALVADRYFPGFIPRRSPPGAWPAIVYEVSEVDHDNTIEGVSGYATATIQIDCYSNLYADAKKLSRVIFKAFDNFSGWMGNIAVWGIWPEDQDDGSETPQDGSGIWWYRRGLTYNVQYIEPKPSH